jgi:hypothetical protein
MRVRRLGCEQGWRGRSPYSGRRVSAASAGGEDDVEIGNRQQLGLPDCQPLGVVPDTSDSADCGRYCKRRTARYAPVSNRLIRQTPSLLDRAEAGRGAACLIDEPCRLGWRRRDIFRHHWRQLSRRWTVTSAPSGDERHRAIAEPRLRRSHRALLGLSDEAPC